jgi:hypothetical protein
MRNKVKNKLIFKKYLLQSNCFQKEKKMKLLLVTLLMMSTAFAATVEEAKTLYTARETSGAGLEKSLSAAKAYEDAAAAETSPEQKAVLLIEASRAYYFYANYLTNNNKKEEIHGLGKDVASTALELAKEINNVDLQAKATYQFGANLGKWAEARGIGASLGEWPKLRDSMETIIKDLKKPEVEYAGALRVLGRAYFKLPSLLGGSNKKSLQYLNKANQLTTITELGFSKYPTNITYLAETMIEEKFITAAKELLTKFITYVKENGAEKYNADLVPETKAEVINAQNILNKL